MAGTIKVRIDRENNVHIEVDGVEGTVCKDYTKNIELALGKQIDTEEKPNYFIELEGQKQKVYES